MASGTSDHLPPLASSGVFAASANIVIDAPIDTVWDTLADFKSYHIWNPFVRAQTIVGADKKPAEDPTPAVGRLLLLAPVHIPPTFDRPGFLGSSSAFEVITVFDREARRMAWRNIEFPAFLLSCERWQWLTPLGPGQTRYETIEVFSGLFAYFLKWFLGAGLRLGFTVMAETLKKRAEALRG